MSFFNVGALAGNPFSSVVGQKIEQATDGALASENWALNMEICDLVNSSPDGPRDAVKAIRKRLQQNAGKNYTTVMYTLTVLETCVKNCSRQLHVLVCNKEFIQELIKLIGPKNDPPTVVQEKVLSLIQCWADAFQHQTELSGVVTMYQELRSKGVQFPMTDLDTMAPIFTPQRSVPSDVVDGVNTAAGDAVNCSPQRAPPSPQLRPARETPPNSMVQLSPSQVNKLHSDLAVVQGNMAVMADMLNEMTSSQNTEHHSGDLELLQELHSTLQAMQSRLVELIGKVSDDSLTGELLRVNDELNSLMLRHQRFSKNRAAAPSAVLAAALGPPTQPGDSLIDLNDVPPSLAALSIADPLPAKPVPSGADKDEFDMFAQSRNLTYESTKNGSSSYADNLEPGQASVGLAALTQSRPTTGQPQTLNDSERDLDEIAAWLNAEEASGFAAEPQESVTSSDFDKFLAERAAAAESTPSTNAAQSTRQRQPKKDDDGMFAL